MSTGKRTLALPRRFWTLAKNCGLDVGEVVRDLPRRRWRSGGNVVVDASEEQLEQLRKHADWVASQRFFAGKPIQASANETLRALRQFAGAAQVG